MTGHEFEVAAERALISIAPPLATRPEAIAACGDLVLAAGLADGEHPPALTGAHMLALMEKAQDGDRLNRLQKQHASQAVHLRSKPEPL